MEQQRPIKVDNQLLGATVHSLRNPTIWLLIVCCSTFFVVIITTLEGHLPTPIAVCINVVVLYSIYTVTHEAIHRIAHPNRKVNDWMGRFSAVMEGTSFPLLSVLHIKHHAYTNHPEKDPDFVIGRQPRWLLPVWTLIRLTHDNGFAIRQQLWKHKKMQLAEHFLTVGLQIAVFTVTFWVGYLEELMVLWILPFIVAGILVELSVGWLVHYPHKSQVPLEHSRLLSNRILSIVMFNQNLHLVHHLWPRIPWYRYGWAVDRANEHVRRYKQH